MDGGRALTNDYSSVGSKSIHWRLIRSIENVKSKPEDLPPRVPRPDGVVTWLAKIEINQPGV